MQRVYTYGHSLISQRQLLNNQWTVSFYGYDGHGSTRFLTDETGAVTDTYTYDAFGSLIAQTGNTPNDYLYAGEQRDSQLGLDYLRARYLNPSSGRFWTTDPYAGDNQEPATLNKFVYANNDPVDNVDPTGLYTLSEVTTNSAEYARFQANYSQIQLATKSHLAVAAIGSQAITVGSAAVAFSLSLSLGILATTLLKTRLAEENYDLVKIIRGADRPNVKDFRVDYDSSGARTGFSTFEEDHLPDSQAKKKFKLPFWVMYKKPKVAYQTTGYVIYPFAFVRYGAQAKYTPHDPGHWDLDMPGLADDQIQQAMVDYTLSIRNKEPFH